MHKAKKVPNELKISDMTSISKNEDALHKSNYRAISKLLLLQKFSKEYYLINYSDFFKYLFIYLFIYSLLLCGFRKAYSTQYVLINYLQKWQRCLDASDGIAGTLLMDLLKAYDCVSHDLIIVKLEAYGVVGNTLRLIQSYPSQRKQRVQVGSSVTEW